MVQCHIRGLLNWVMRPIRTFLHPQILSFLVCLGLAPLALAADEVSTIVPQTWQLLDYLAIDYAGAVNDGAVRSASEYAEMREFVATARARIGSLPTSPQQHALEQQAETLVRAVDGKA